MTDVCFPQDTPKPGLSFKRDLANSRRPAGESDACEGTGIAHILKNLVNMVRHMHDRGCIALTNPIYVRPGWLRGPFQARKEKREDAEGCS